MTYSRLAVALVLSVTALTACGNEGDTRAVDPAASDYGRSVISWVGVRRRPV